MKYIFIILSGSLLFFGCTNNDAAAINSKEDSARRAKAMEAAADTANYTSIQWIDSTAQNVGKINEGQVAEVSWHFKNSGNKPLIIVNATPSCGCTLADKPEEPIAPGEEGIIKAKFDSKGQHEGEHQKTVTVQANTKNSSLHQLLFRAEVIKK
jgi:hypothetical protein